MEENSSGEIVRLYVVTRNAIRKKQRSKVLLRARERMPEACLPKHGYERMASKKRRGRVRKVGREREGAMSGQASKPRRQNRKSPRESLRK